MQRQISPEEINSNKFECSGIALKTQALCCGYFHLALNGTVWFLAPALLCSSLRFVFPYVGNSSFRIKKKKKKLSQHFTSKTISFKEHVILMSVE